MVDLHDRILGIRPERAEDLRRREPGVIERSGTGRAGIDRDRVGVEVAPEVGRDLVSRRRPDPTAEAGRRDRGCQIGVVVVIGRNDDLEPLGGRLLHAIFPQDA